ncbi:OsmC family protein [Methylobacterium sp. J-088]|uniref:OsmC family protein n=1 Tax=unclassified Methylobacterium TaxID=2615210 RepID=UPI001FBB80F6|nr:MULTISPECIES: OsmC family protein [unclassified Methylobacterium]MCJ2067137.1 OsmC family protein [Methylobacterium sp. J-088]
MDAGPTIRITQVDAYVFTVDFGAALPALVTDEAPPIGGGTGPFPEQILISGVANCLCASLVFALGKFRQDARGVVAEAQCRMDRNAEGRLRIAGIDVRIGLGAVAAEMPRIDRVLEQFERFCTVSESVKDGIPVSVSVTDRDGKSLK